jgi:hypothetical protein
MAHSRQRAPGHNLGLGHENLSRPLGSVSLPDQRRPLILIRWPSTIPGWTEPYTGQANTISLWANTVRCRKHWGEGSAAASPSAARVPTGGWKRHRQAASRWCWSTRTHPNEGELWRLGEVQAQDGLSFYPYGGSYPHRQWSLCCGQRPTSSTRIQMSKTRVDPVRWWRWLFPHGDDDPWTTAVHHQVNGPSV